MNAFGKDRFYPLGIILIVLSISTYLFSSHIYYRQKSNLIAEHQARIQIEIDLIGAILNDLLCKNRPADINNVLKLWSDSHRHIILLDAVLDTGEVLFSHHALGTKMGRGSYVATKHIYCAGHTLNIALAHDSIELAATLRELRRNLELLTLYLVAFVGLTLWFVLFRWLIRPMRIEIHRQTQILRDVVAYTEGFFNAINAHIAILDSNGDIISTNRAWQTFAQANGYKDDPAMIGQPYSVMASSLYQAPECCESWSLSVKEIAMGLRPNYTCEHGCNNQGRCRWFIMRVLPVPASNPPLMIVTHEDVTYIKESMLALDRLSTTDKLTQLHNRTKLDEVLEEAGKQAKRYGTPPLSIILTDIDYFKRVNDTYGHQAGDRALVQFAKIVRENIRDSDIVGRWGGEEFLIICFHTDVEGAKCLAEKLRSAIESTKIEKVGTITASFGVAEFMPNDDVDNLLGRADDALYAAKAQGRNRVVT